MTKYSRTVQWSEQDDAYLAICPELAGVSAFGDSPEEALAELDVVIELTIETYEEKGWKLPAPNVATEYSGQFRARLPRSLHQQLAQRAEAEGVSQNTLVITYLAAGLGQAQAEERLGTLLQQLVPSFFGFERAMSSAPELVKVGSSRSTSRRFVPEGFAVA
jgi:predicted RNase H-like HicB family nuclease